MNNIFNLDSKFMQIMNKFADLMLLNVITMICCIPIITIGPAITAMHYVLLKLYRNEGGYLMRNYFKSFKENFRQSTVLGLIYVAIAAVVVVDIIYIRRVPDVSLVIEVVVIVAAVLSAFSYVWVFPLQCRYENKIRTTVKNSFMVGALNFPKSIMMILISFAPILVLMWTNAAVPVVFLLGLALPAYVQAMLYSPVFDKLEGIDRTADGEIIDDGWTVELEETDAEALAERWEAPGIEAEKEASVSEAAAAEVEQSEVPVAEENQTEERQNDGENQN